ncbi:hypothetical protein KBC54_03130 [Patescibacteria group bacterium]|nr:hypothetical protein [Patescibacteria group bacterium]
MSSIAEEFCRALEALGNISEEERTRRREEVKGRLRQLPNLPLPKERDTATLNSFFTHEVLGERVLICPQINVDLLDHWEIYGHEPGFIYIVGLKPEWERPSTMSEESWVQGTLVGMHPGLVCGSISAYAHFPVRMLDYELLTHSRDCPAFEHLLGRVRLPSLNAAMRELE